MVMVAAANKSDDELGGHIASFAGRHAVRHRPAALLERAARRTRRRLIYFQGHLAGRLRALAHEGRLPRTGFVSGAKSTARAFLRIRIRG